MSTARIDLGTLPAAAQSVLLEYRRKGSRAWLKLGETTQPVSEWAISGGDVEVRARVRDKGGQLHPGTVVSWDTESALSDLPLPHDLTWPNPEVRQDGPTLTLKADVVAGLDPADYEMEFRQGEDSGAAKDGLQIGFVAPQEEICCFAWPTSTGPGTQTIHVRAHRLSDGRMSDWTTVDFTSPQPVIAPTTGHSNDFASGSIGTVGNGTATLEINGGDLRQVAIYAGDLDGAADFAGNFTDVYAGDADIYWSPGYYSTASVPVSPAEDLVFQVYPDLTSITRKGTLFAGDCHWPAKMPRFQFEDNSYHDPRVFEDSLQNGADETPVVITYEININGAGLEDLIPGKVYASVSSYVIRATITTYLQKLITIDNLYVRHWIWCRARPWHSHSDAFELIHENTIAGAAVATYDISLSGDDYDELFLEVTWKNADATATNLWLRPNNDSGANYDLDGGGDTKVIVGPSGTVAQNEWEYARVRFHNPPATAERGITVEENARWTATTSSSSDASDTYVWTDNSNEITTIRVTTQHGNNALAVGTQTRLWGKRHHAE